MRTFAGQILAATALVLAAPAPAGADVKAGVDAWAAGDFRRAVEEWRGPAIAGDADAQFNMGQAYKLGRGVPVDPALAESWFRKAALQGHLLAEDNYGLALFGAGRKADAVPWLEKSVARGEPRTQMIYGTMLFNGDGVPRDYPRAYALMTLASRKGSQAAGETLAQMDQYISPENREKGTRLAEQYAAQTRLNAAAMPPSGRSAVARAPMPPSAVAEDRDGIVYVTPGQSARSPRPLPRRVAPAPVAAPVAAVRAPAPTVPRPGAWRIQLGAFRDRANAETLWNRIRTRLPGAQPDYVAGGGVTRLQATGYATRALATRACAAAKTTCVVVAP